MGQDVGEQFMGEGIEGDAAALVDDVDDEGFGWGSEGECGWVG